MSNTTEINLFELNNFIDKYDTTYDLPFDFIEKSYDYDIAESNKKKRIYNYMI